jgi:hypothetical protein
LGPFLALMRTPSITLSSTTLPICLQYPVLIYSSVKLPFPSTSRALNIICCLSISSDYNTDVVKCWHAANLNLFWIEISFRPSWTSERWSYWAAVPSSRAALYVESQSFSRAWSAVGLYSTSAVSKLLMNSYARALILAQSVFPIVELTLSES